MEDGSELYVGCIKESIIQVEQLYRVNVLWVFFVITLAFSDGVEKIC